MNGVAIRKDIENVLKLRQALLKRKNLNIEIVKSQQKFFEMYAVEIGKLVKNVGVNVTIYPDATPVTGFTTELAQWMV